LNFSIKTIVVILAVAAVSCIGLAVAYTMISNPVTGTVVPEATLSLTINGLDEATITVGETFTLVATCSDTSYTGSVTFTADGSTVLGTQTAAAGVATLSWTPTTTGTYSIVATADHT